MTITTLKPTAVPAPTKPVRVKRQERKPRTKNVALVKTAWMPKAAWFVLAATTGLLLLSLYHLVTGILMVTGASVFEAWAMAIGIDIMFVAVESVLLTAPAERIDHLTAHVMVGITIAVSTVMNVIGFAENAPETLLFGVSLKYLAASFGALVPGLIYGGTRLIGRMASR